MAQKEQKIDIWCLKCDYKSTINLPVESKFFGQLVDAHLIIHENQQGCHDDLIVNMRESIDKLKKVAKNTVSDSLKQ